MKKTQETKVYRATWMDHLPETADVDDGPNYRTVERECKHTRGKDCCCERSAAFAASHQSYTGPQPGYYILRIYRIKKRIKTAKRCEHYDDRELELLSERHYPEQVVLPGMGVVLPAV